MRRMDKHTGAAISITWARTVPRSKGIAEAFGAQDFYIEYLKHAPAFLLPVRYLLQTVKTIAALARTRPRLIIATNPPSFVPLITYVYASLTGARFIIDSHTGAFLGRWKILLPLQRFLSRRALVTLVTNEELRSCVASWNASGVVLEDRLPDLPMQASAQPNEQFSVAVINSFSADEPLDEILAAARMLGDYRFYITGRLPRGFAERYGQVPANVTFTGFLPKPEYVALLNRVDTVMVLVTTDFTLLCGAYEAVSLEKPLITSDWPALKSYFSRGALYVDNTPEAIAEAVKKAAACSERLRLEMHEFKSTLEQQWNERFDAVRAQVRASV
jgi:glycosyltransferase involved in cell wall biosynthesis